MSLKASALPGLEATSREPSLSAVGVDLGRRPWVLLRFQDWRG